jgi:peroxiredoxin
LEIVLSSPKRPQFSLEIASKSQGMLALETWGDELILHGATQFVSLMKLKEGDHEVALSVLWDMKAKRFAAFRPDGTPLCDWQTDSDTKKVGRFTIANPQKPDFTGVQFTNKCPEITLKHLRITKWDGKTPDKRDSSKPGICLLDGHVVEGSIVRATADSLVINAGGAEKTVAMKDIDVVHFTPEPLKDAPPVQARLWCEDDAFLAGKMQTADTGAVTLQTSFSDEPVPTNTTAIKTLKLDVPPPAGAPEETPLNRLERITLGPTTVHGTWVSNNEAKLSWLPVGCEKPVSIAANAGAYEIFRVMPADGKFPRSNGLLHLNSGDVLPGSVTSLNNSEIAIDAPLLGIKTLPTKLLRCVQFGDMELKTQGFQDGGWRISHGTAKTVRRDGDTVTLDPGGGFGHPSILQGDDVRFSVIGERGMGVVRVRLFCNGSDSSSPNTSLLFAHYGSSFYAGLETSEGQMQSRCQMKATGKVACRLQLRAKEIEVFLNNTPMLKISTATQKRSGLGLVFEAGDLWGNGARTVVVSDFSVRPNPGKAWIPAVDTVARGQALLVPRFRKEDPPKQVLIAANGDLLRGELIAATPSHLAFRSGLESLQVPRDRVAAAIWLQKAEEKKPDDATAKTEPTKAPEAPDDGSTHWLQLTGGARFGLKVTKFEADAITGSSPLVGECRIPMENIFKIRSTRPAPDSVTHAFDEWKLEFAPEPVLPENGAQSSPLLGKETKDFTLPMLSDAKFELGKQKGKVVVLDFWATWCGPCIRSLPELIEAMAPFPADKVQFIGVNQGESKDQVSKFLTQRGWKMNVVLDSSQSVGRQFGVEGIPHTVILGPDGKVAWVKTGYAKENAAEAAETVKKLMETAVPK